MMEVRWELEGNGIDQSSAEAAMQRVLNYYDRALADLTCPAHGRAPWLTVRGRMVKDLAVRVECCCPILQSQAEERLRRVSRRDE